MTTLSTIQPWRALAPGAWRSALVGWETDLGAQRLEKRRLLESSTLHDVSPKIGEAWFPLALPESPIRGVLVRVRVGGTGLRVDDAVVKQARWWLMALAGTESPGALAGLQPVCPDLPEDIRVEGSSMGAALAVAMLSALLGRPPAEPVIISAALGPPDPRAMVEAVGHIPAKQDTVSTEAPGIKAMICAAPGSLLRALGGWMGPGWRGALCDALGGSARALALGALDAYKQRAYPLALSRAEAAMHGAGGALRGLALLVSGACWMHRAEPELALERMTEALELLQEAPPEDSIPPLMPEEAKALAGVALLDCWRPGEAVRLLRASLKTLVDHPLRQYDLVQWRSTTLKVAGTLRRALVFSGQATEAAAVQRRWALDLARSPDQLARCCGDLAETLRLTGDLPAAREALALARSHLSDTRPQDRPATSRYLAVYEARSGVREAGWDVTPPDWEHFPQPLEVLESLLQGPPEALDAWMTAHATGGSRSMELVFLGIAARMAAREGRTPGWLTALTTRSLAHPALEPGVIDALQALAAGDGAPWMRIAPY